MIVEKYLPLSGSVIYYKSERPISPRELEEIDILMLKGCMTPYEEEENE
jgi:hypothetical protein